MRGIGEHVFISLVGILREIRHDDGIGCGNRKADTRWNSSCLIVSTMQGILLDIMLYAKLHNSFADFLFPDVLIMKNRTPCGIVRWELEAVEAHFTYDGVTR
jgi:hypothetical protein